MIWRITLLEARVGELAAAIIRRRLLAFIISTPTRSIRSSPPDAPAPSEPKPLATSVTGGSGGRGLRCLGAPAVCACASSVTRGRGNEGPSRRPLRLRCHTFPPLTQFAWSLGTRLRGTEGKVAGLPRAFGKRRKVSKALGF